MRCSETAAETRPVSTRRRWRRTDGVAAASFTVRIDSSAETSARPKAARAVEASAGHRVAAALGPDRRLAVVLARRLGEALEAAGEPGVGPLDRVLMVCAGSSDPRAGRDCERVAQMLSDELGHPVGTAYLSAAAPALPDAMAAARKEIAARGAQDPSGGQPPAGRVLLATYLLAPGFFHGRALAAGADIASEPLLVDPGEVPVELVDLVVEHYREAAPAA